MMTTNVGNVVENPESELEHTNTGKTWKTATNEAKRTMFSVRRFICSGHLKRDHTAGVLCSCTCFSMAQSPMQDWRICNF